MSTALERAHGVNGTLSDMVAASDAAAQIVALRALASPGGQSAGLARPGPAAGPGLARTAPDRSAAAEDSLLLGMATTILALARGVGLPAPRVGLEAFAAFLQAHGILSEKLDYSADEARLQKCAYIAQEGFGLNLGYDYHIHAYGTFSSFIAADFAELAKRTARAGGSPMPPQFRAKEFLALVSKRGIDWLCVASTVVHERGSCGPGELRPRVERMSAGHNRGLVRGAMAAVGAALGPPRAAGAPA